MSAKYTPGPWATEEVANPVEGASSLVVCTADFEYRIADAYAPVHHDGMAVPYEQAEANARLIAEAPAMVELARAFVSYLEDDSRSERRRQACLAEARAILARIEGSQ